MKRKRGIFLLLALLLLCGCGADAPAVGGEPTAEPERALLFTCQNYHYAFYTEIGGGLLDFYILSNLPLDPETIAVDTGLLCQSKVTVQARELESGDTYEVEGEEGAVGRYAGPTYCPEEVYLTYQIVDWGPLLILAEQYAAAETPAARAELLGQLLDQYRRMADAAREALPREVWNETGCPQLYACEVLVELFAPTGILESTDAIRVTVDGEEYAVPCGRILADGLHSTAELGHTGDDALLQEILFLGRSAPEPYSGGWFCLAGLPAVSLLAHEDLTVTDMTLLDDGFAYELTELAAAVTDERGLRTEFAWDGETPFPLRAGSTLELSPVLYDPAMDDLVYQSEPHLLLRYRQDKGPTYGRILSLPISLSPNLYAFYAQEQDGVDLAAYYRGYYIPWLAPDDVHERIYGFRREVVGP